MTDTTRPLAVVTGASSGIGFELAKLCAEHGCNLIIAADHPDIDTAADALRSIGVTVEPLLVDLATQEGVEQLHGLIGGRPVDYLLANAGHGLGRGFLDQDFNEIRHVARHFDADANLVWDQAEARAFEREVGIRWIPA